MKQIVAIWLLVGCSLVSAQENEAQESQQSLTDSVVVEASKPELADDTRVALEGQASLDSAQSEASELKDLPLAATYDSLWLKELTEAASRYGDMYAVVQEAVSDSTLDALEGWDTEVFKERLAEMDALTPFEVEYNPSLERVVKSFLLQRRDLMERMLSASQFYFPLFEESLAKNDLPLELKYLAIVESALNPRARSRVGATGLWQFMYGTGRMYGLSVSSYVDERNDPLLATAAASAYLSKLYEIFGDWDLALAAYNSGPGNVNKAIRRSGGQTNYWNIRRNLPRETAGYVPAFLATYYIFHYAEEHGLRPTEAPRPYLETDTIHIKQTLTFDQISKVTAISVPELRILNPAYKLDIIPKVKGKEYALRLPVYAIGRFVNNEAKIYEEAKEALAKREKPLPELVQAEDRIRYRVRSGDYLGKIAERYGVGVSQIKRWNGLRSNNLRIGQRLTIYPRKPVTTAKPSTSNSSKETTTTASSSAGGAKIHVVRKGDSLWTISQQYPGVSIENLKEWNGLRGNTLMPGTRLKLCNCNSL
ncbi:membrane-bound lytic murein transglycosylase D [Robiginitalea myxolifaciens]|uniref:Membrane-bound lytic murein transglycosylase D n=1 Tax=Robiginitalea myxolifaciens TaxID=400055 RepID=A0A1I6G335_9FLAO|nr:LysM peptidoglycan-binding domain-containing protein [Robiginitalea myxolifaciens]SFR36530.1 membrane-bound lytic murein transglycosylase D [Robiginitalea myxolifaciens]